MHLFRKYGGLLQLPKNVKDVDITLLAAYPSIDKGIEKLVKALAILDFNIEASCEGHMQHNRHHHPWIYIFDLRSYENLISWLEKYNKTEEIKWKTDKDCLRTIQEAKNEKELIDLQKSSDKLAEYLFANYYINKPTN